MIYQGSTAPLATLSASDVVTIDATGQWQRHIIQLVATGDWSVTPQTSLDGGVTWAALPPGTATAVTAAASQIILLDYGGPVRLLCVRTGGDLSVYERHTDDMTGAAR